MNDNFYKQFEDRFRGSRELIMSRLSAYAPLLELMQKMHSNSTIIDLGCGRGEWLEVASGYGFNCIGVDSDVGMLNVAKINNLTTVCLDVIEFLKTVDSNSVSIVSGFHIVEHLDFSKLQELIIHANRVLVDGGVLILETPNPDNIKVATSWFYLDPTHIKPIPSELLSFMVEYGGFSNVKTIGLNHKISSDSATLLSVLTDASPDYSIIGQKNTNQNVVEILLNNGVATHDLASKFDEKIAHLFDLSQKSFELSLKNSTEINELHTVYLKIINSRTWKILNIIRKIIKFVFDCRSIECIKKIKHKLKFYFSKIKNRCMFYISKKPKLKKFIIKILTPFPVIKNKFLSQINNKHISMQNMKFSSSSISVNANKICENLLKTDKL